MIHASKKQTTPRLLMPQWQGGDYDLSARTGELYPLGARILAFLAPQGEEPVVEVPVEPYVPGAERPKKNGVVHQDTVLKQMRAAREIIEERRPDRIIVFGGDCLISEAPFDYLNGRYKGNLGILWIDAHPDVSTPKNHDREHAMILGNLLGGGDPFFARDVQNPLKPQQVILIGIDRYNTPEEAETVQQLALPVLEASDVAVNSDAVLRWLRENQFANVAIHLDLDVLDPNAFYSQFPNDPAGGQKFNTALGKMTFPQLTRLIRDVAANATVVGLNIAEHMPWDAYNLKHMMEQFSFMR